ncbi:MAG TPA: HEPN domain-containing protein [Candidatus Thermoplasmatota archaeon]|nr:HEPN domain-containing protein [Candidatus Thermoplasmatota archaeon]
MHEYLAAAEVAAANGLHAPAHHHAMHALELGLKAALIADGEPPVRTHNPAGQFGHRFRGRVPDETLRSINRALARYHEMRYPGGSMEVEEIEEALAFARRFLVDRLPALL